MSKADDPGFFAPWRFRRELGDHSPEGWYYLRPPEVGGHHQAGPFDTRREAKADARASRAAFGLYGKDSNGGRVVHIEGDFRVIDRMDAPDYMAGAVEAGERFVVTLDDVPALPVPGCFAETLRQALTIIDAVRLFQGEDGDAAYLARFPDHARPFADLAYKHGAEDHAVTEN